ncbi:MAG TPA: hypothetical protein VF933_09485 [Streptosporangiaceae bacterium]
MVTDRRWTGPAPSRAGLSCSGRWWRSARARAWRAALSALGIAIGIGAGVAVLGVSASSRAACSASWARKATC